MRHVQSDVEIGNCGLLFFVFLMYRFRMGASDSGSEDRRIFGLLVQHFSKS